MKSVRLFRIVLVNVVVFLVGLGILEACLSGRLDVTPNVDYVPGLEITVNRPNLKHTSQAQRYTAAGKLESYSYAVQTDSEGCRVSTLTVASATGPTVALVGDSFSFGYNASYEESLGGRLAGALPGATIVDFAVPGTCSAEYSRTLDYYLGRKGHPKLAALVVGLYVDGVCGDIPRLLARQAYGGYRTFEGHSVSATNYARLTHSSWARVKFRAEVLLRRYSSIYNRLVQPRPEPEFAVPLPAQVPEDLGKYVTSQVLANLEMVHEKSGLPAARIVVYLIPSAGDTLKMSAKRVTAAEPLHGLLWNGIKQTLLERGYHVVDPRTEFAERVAKGETWPFTTDSHLTPAGFEWVSAPVIKEIEALLSRP